MKDINKFKVLVAALAAAVSFAAFGATTIDWVGGGADNLTTTLENWRLNGETPTEPLNLKDGSLDVIIKGGTGMKYADGDKFNTLTSDYPILVDDESSTFPFVIEPVAAGASLFLEKGFTSDAKRQIVIRGHITHAGATVPEFWYRPYNVGSPTIVDGVINYNMTSASARSAPLVFDGAELDMNLKLPISNMVTGFLTYSNSENLVTGAITITQAQNGLSMMPGSKITVRNGVSSSVYFHLMGEGEFQVEGSDKKTLTGGSSIESGARLTLAGAPHTFEVTGNSSREGLLMWRCEVEFKTCNVLTEDTQFSIDRGGDKNIVEFNATTQRIGRVQFVSSNANSYLHGDSGSMLEISGVVRGEALQYTKLKEPKCNTQIRGALGIHMMGASTNVFTLYGKAFESCGDLIVSAGTNMLDTTATWLNGTNFVMKGEGVMMFAKNGQVNRDFAQFHFSENGKVYIPSGVVLDCRCALVDDGTGEQFLPSGGYGEAATGLMEGRVVGGGMLNVIAATPFEQPDYVETTEDMTAQGDWVVEVEMGKSNVVTVAQTGAGKIIKRGGGTLVLRATNEFTGGIDIVHGIVCAEANDALGFGEVTIFGGQRDDYVGPCELRFPVCDLTFGSADGAKPSIHVIGQNTAKYPAIGVCSIRNTFYGAITSDYDLYLMDDQQWLFAQKGSWSTGVSPNTGMTLYGDVNVAGKFHLYPDTRYYFHGSVKADTFEAKKNGDGAYLHCGDKMESWTYGQIFFYKANAFNMFFTSHDTINFVAANSMGGACFTNTFTSESASLVCSADQTAASIYHAKPASSATTSFSKVYGTSAMTLTLTGTTQNVETYTKFSDALSLVLDAKDNPSFIYTLRELPSTLGGTVTVSNGTLRLIEGASFPSATAITVEQNGVLIVENAAAQSFGATALTVDGALTIDPAVFKNLASLDLALGENAVLTFPAGTTALTVKSLTYKGEKLPASDWNRTEIPVIPEGLTITATTGQSGVAAEVTAVWTGAEGDGLMATLGNWEVDGEVPTELDLTSGKTAVIIAGGTQMIPEDGMRVNFISNGIPGTTTSESFTLGKKGATLTVDGKIMSINAAQLIIRGTIATPWHRSQGEAGNYGSKTFTYRASTAENASALTSDHKSLPVVLDDAVIEKPVYFKSQNTGRDTFFIMANTTNVVSGHAVLTSSAWQRYTVVTGGFVDFCGGMSRSYRQVKYGEGTLKITGEALTGSDGMNHEGGMVVLDLANSTFGNTGTQNKGFKMGDGTGAILRFARSFCFKDDNAQQLNVTGSAKNNLIDFGSTTQRLSRACANNTGAGSLLTGEAGSMLEVKGGTTLDSANVLPDMIFSTQIAGGLGIHYLGNGPAKSGVVPAGSAETLVLTNRAFESTGNLEVSGGTLELAAGATWLNGTNFTAKGTGTLKFAAAGQVSKTFSVLHVADQGQIYVPEGVRVRFVSATLDGEPVDEAIYPTGTEGSTGLSAHITGGGSIRVKRPGTVLVVQ